jgi:putative membrane protein
MFGMHYGFVGLSLLLVVGLLVIGVVVAVAMSSRSASPGDASPLAGRAPADIDPTAGAVRILADRLALGEIDEETYHQRLAALRGVGRRPGP